MLFDFDGYVVVCYVWCMSVLVDDGVVVLEGLVMYYIKCDLEVGVYFIFEKVMEFV